MIAEISETIRARIFGLSMRKFFQHSFLSYVILIQFFAKQFNLIDKLMLLQSFFCVANTFCRSSVLNFSFVNISFNKMNYKSFPFRPVTILFTRTFEFCNICLDFLTLNRKVRRYVVF